MVGGNSRVVLGLFSQTTASFTPLLSNTSNCHFKRVSREQDKALRMVEKGKFAPTI